MMSDVAITPGYGTLLYSPIIGYFPFIDFLITESFSLDKMKSKLNFKHTAKKEKLCCFHHEAFLRVLFILSGFCKLG
jgi:hypothetical protein